MERARSLDKTRRPYSAVLGAALLAAMIGCTGDIPGVPAMNPFRDLPPIELNGQPERMTYSVAPLGTLAEGDVIRLKIEGQAVASVLILLEDPQSAEAADLAGGGPPNEVFDYRVQIGGRYFALALFSSSTSETSQRATITASRGDSIYQPPAAQFVRIVFEPDYLTNPGLLDPDSSTAEDRQLLSDISGIVRDGVVARLRTVFDGTPVVILGEGDLPPSGLFSTLTFLARREPAREGDVFEVVQPPLQAQHPECSDRVIFGEVLPRGSWVDAGNRMPNDEAVVYVGSFQGRGESCRSAATDSVNNIILGLSQTAAHEIGHLVGLYHVPLTDIMNRSVTLAFQRELAFQQGQLQLDVGANSEILTTVVQDPALYFRANFSR